MAAFRDIIGQEQIKEHLQAAISGDKVSHAYIISGENLRARSLLQEYLP